MNNKGKNNPFYGKHHTAEARKKMSEAKKKNPTRYWKGKKLGFIPSGGFKKGHATWNKGKKGMPWSGRKRVFTEEWKRHLSEAQTGKKGKLSNAYRHGKSKEYQLIRGSKKFIEWRYKVKQRDDWTCQKCGTKSGNGKRVYLEAHHKKSFARFPKLRFDVSNGITLCKSCHKLTDNYCAAATTKCKDTER